MELIKISDNCYYFHSAVNAGYVQKGDQGLLIDAGIDKSAANKILRQLEEQGLPLTHLFITHAHSDHFGGAAQLQKKTAVYTLAPFFEEAIMRYPKLEPMYLFGGNNPPKEMRNKFLEGPPIRIDQVCRKGQLNVDGFQLELFYLPGHSDYQLAVKTEDVLYAADSYFSEEQLQKHRIPFMIDVGEGLASLEKVKEIPCKGAVPGHGVFETEFQKTVERNIQYHREILDDVIELLRERPEGRSHEEMVQLMCRKRDVPATSVPSWTLFRTAVTAYLKKLADDGSVRMALNDYRLWYILSEDD
ncbi:MAG TPA: MBL fold metallo-hydrolase [Bacillales bacterium]|nr:MBL fold metallo-hydrolase [Bacillales bacterium]